MDTALALPLEDLAPNPYAKLSGIASVLGEVLEANNKHEEAYEVYAEALGRIHDALLKQQTDTSVPPQLRVSSQERARAAALAFKLGMMAEQYSQPDSEVEKWLTYSVNELLRVLQDFQQAGPVPLNLYDLMLPPWVTRIHIAAPMERLAAFYQRVDRQE